MDRVHIQLNDFDNTEDDGFINIDGKPVNAQQLGAALSDHLNHVLKQLPRSASIVFSIAVFDTAQEATSFLTSLETGRKTLDKSD